ncbi:hypothetical protein [Methylobacterium bullatum]|uniref:Uncharacterized protein n=1 Tax=Methylobacterium bullatum TaxID=570505 RepID=A0AAV4Z8Z8_9HYPH|nr:hypothetical protein [Methylobacterium bullatum]MBD8905060.1 hypothetical protein [Methylobacterium bullatum]GJD40074.1 hypothetical protein OICFNHDK_2539 [Methylobacterium bullatum]
MKTQLPATRVLAQIIAFLPVLALGVPASAQEGMKVQVPADRIKEVPAIEPSGLSALKPGTILFTDHRDNPANPESGLTPYLEWRKLRPAEQAALAPYPAYAEPDYSVTLNGVSKQRHETLKVYVAQGRFVVGKPAESIDLSAFANLGFVSKMDPVIKHKTLSPAEVTPTKDPAAAFARRPDRAWCEGAAACIESRYDLEGKLPLGVKLANKLEDGASKKVAEFVSFQSELRTLPAAEAASLAALTRVDTPVAGGLEQTIFWVNQILRFGKFLAVFQPMPNDPGKTVVTTYMALAIKADVLDRKQEYARVPVLKNLLPAQVLMGNSSFNTGTSISAGLPTYARNRMIAFADALAKN